MFKLSMYRDKALTWIMMPALITAQFGLPMLVSTPAAAQVVASNPLGSLKTVPTPQPKNLNQFLRTVGKGGAIDPRARASAIALGKALFWDQAAGSDGQACASCHFNAGADSRTFNQLDPGLRALPPDRFFSNEDPFFFSANYQLQVTSFPFTRFFNPDTRSSGIRFDTNDICSSQGVFDTTFVSVAPHKCPADQPHLGSICDTGSTGSTFQNGGFLDIFAPGRNVEPRNTPTMINAVFNHRNFWDGRARNEFNGVNPIGDLDPSARVLLHKLGKLVKVSLTGDLRLENSSLASQAVGPPLSDMEMSFRGRTFPDLGRKMLAFRHALPSQVVDPRDSVLGKNHLADVSSRYPEKGIDVSYKDLIKAAFQERWWDSDDWTTDGFTQMEANFSLFWGIAVQLYEATLRADDSPFDRAFDSGDPTTYNASGWGDLEKQGLQVFQGQGKCVNCHGGPETTNASVRNVQNEKISRMLMGNKEQAVYDEGFYNTAVRRCKIGEVCDDQGIGATIGPLNLPLSMSRFFELVVAKDPIVDQVCATTPEACRIPEVTGIPGELQAKERVAVDGAFKTPGLRNIALQAPFFHNGGDLDLEHVVQFYDRGGNFHDLNILNLDPDIEDLGLTDHDKDALVALLKAMTDERVQFQKAPFDHPQLFVPKLGELAAVGANGSKRLLKTFFDNLQNPPATTP